MGVTGPDSFTATNPQISEDTAADPTVSPAIELIIHQGKRLAAIKGIALLPEPSGWYPGTRTQVVSLQPFESAREVPVSDFMKIGEVQAGILEQIEQYNQQAAPNEQVKITFIADGSNIHVDGDFSGLNNIAAKLVEQTAFKSQIMILPGEIPQKLMRGFISLISLDRKYRDRFYVAGSMEEALKLAQKLNTQADAQD